MRYLLFVLLIIFALPIYAENEPCYALVDINAIGEKALIEIKSLPYIKWWVELDDRLLVFAQKEELKKLKKAKILTLTPAPQNLYFVYMDQRRIYDQKGVTLLAAAGRHAVVQSLHLKANQDGVRPFIPNTILARQAMNMPQTRSIYEFNSQDKEIIDQVSGERWFADVEKLATFNRYTHGQGIIEARNWLLEQYRKLPGLEVKSVDFPVGSTTAYNVVATLRGSKFPDKWFIVGAHYDSTSQSPMSEAPGAEDNASGTAAVLEMARLFSKYPPEVTIIFINYSAEEVGLRGSEKHVKDIIAEKEKIKAVITMDMIGFTADADFDCLLETASSGKHYFDLFTDAAHKFTSLRIVTSLNPFGSDHMPYIRKNIPALLVIQNDWSSYNHYHKTTDRPEHINVSFATQILRMNVAALLALIGESR